MQHSDSILTRRSVLKRAGIGIGLLAFAGFVRERCSRHVGGANTFARQSQTCHPRVLEWRYVTVDTFDPKPELTKRGGKCSPLGICKPNARRVSRFLRRLNSNNTAKAGFQSATSSPSFKVCRRSRRCPLDVCGITEPRDVAHADEHRRSAFGATKFWVVAQLRYGHGEQELARFRRSVSGRIAGWRCG